MGILAVATTASFAEEESIMLDLDTVVEEVASEPVEEISEPTEDVVVEEVVVEDVAPEEENNETQEFTTHPEGDADFVTLINQQRQNWDENSVVIATGERGDFLNYINETPEILDIYNRKDKVAMFLSVENPAQYIQPGKCMVNTIPYDVAKDVGTSTDCAWRLFCGGELPAEGFYAVELCGSMVQD